MDNTTTTLHSSNFAQYHNKIIHDILWTTYSLQHCKLRGNIIHTDSVGRTTCPLSSVGWYDWLLTVWWTHQWQLHWLMAAKHFYIYGHRQKMENYFGKFLFFYILTTSFGMRHRLLWLIIFSVSNTCADLVCLKRPEIVFYYLL